MRDAVAHRGPDGRGSEFFTWRGSAYVVAEETGEDRWSGALANRRLSIVDLSPSGRLPMSYRERYWVAYNGEVYNFVEVRAELERRGHSFRSTSDTEVILAAYAEWGTECFRRFRGMWGLVLVDVERREAILSRDRLGMKPLYVWCGDGLVVVVSEIKQLLELPGFRARIDPVASAEFIQTGYEDEARSFFDGVRPLPPGTWQKLELDSLTLESPESFWAPERTEVAIRDAGEAARLFTGKLRECVRIHLRSDVPVGCALSGGLDSSSIAVLVDELNSSAEPLHTFTSTFPGDPIDEKAFVDAVLGRIRAVPHFVTPDPLEFLDDLDRFVWVHDEPVGSFSQYAGYCVARKTREAGVPVTLNGQGGDELLGGYWPCYFMYLRELGREGRVVPLIRHFAGAWLGSGNPSLWEQLPVVTRRYRARERPFNVRLRGPLHGRGGTILGQVMALKGQARRLHDIRSMYLPRLLKWEDRNFMAFSVEGRYPFLDHELIELALSFAPGTLYSRGWTKWPLRMGLSAELPPEIRWRRSKFGFETPQDRWLGGALRPHIEAWLRRDCGVWELMDREDIRALAAHTWRLQGHRDEPGQMLFRVFLFDRWLEIFGLES